MDDLIVNNETIDTLICDRYQMKHGVKVASFGEIASDCLSYHET